MADRPILFSSSMVRALIAGTKTQTRRGLNPQPHFFRVWQDEDTKAWWQSGHGEAGDDPIHLRIAVGDRLYVREHWRTFVSLDAIAPRDLWAQDCGKGAGVLYIADSSGMSLTAQGERFYGEREGDKDAFGKHRQAMHMPRWASRITLTVTDVRIQRLQDITEADALAEGMTQATADAIMSSDELQVYATTHIVAPQARGRILYETIWDQINGDGAWEANPWVAAYTFTVAMGNIDQLARAA